MNHLLRTLNQLNKLANEKLDESELRVNDLRGYKQGNTTHIYVTDYSTTYVLKDGKWQAVSPF